MKAPLWDKGWNIHFKEQILKTQLFLIFYLHYKTIIMYTHQCSVLIWRVKMKSIKFYCFFIIYCWWCRNCYRKYSYSFFIRMCRLYTVYSILIHQLQSLKILDPKIFSVSTQIRCNKLFHPRVCIVAPHYLKKGHIPCLSSLSEHHPSDVSLLSVILKEENKRMEKSIQTANI